MTTWMQPISIRFFQKRWITIFKQPQRTDPHTSEGHTRKRQNLEEHTPERQNLEGYTSEQWTT